MKQANSIMLTDGSNATTYVHLQTRRIEIACIESNTDLIHKPLIYSALHPGRRTAIPNFSPSASESALKLHDRRSPSLSLSILIHGLYLDHVERSPEFGRVARFPPFIQLTAIIDLLQVTEYKPGRERRFLLRLRPDVVTAAYQLRTGHRQCRPMRPHLQYVAERAGGFVRHAPAGILISCFIK